MDIEKAIDCLKADKEYLTDMKICDGEEMDIAIKALEKQIPKKPIIHTNDIDKDRLACCPVCYSNVDWTYEGFWRKGNPKYCKNCGQAIDWSD